MMLIPITVVLPSGLSPLPRYYCNICPHYRHCHDKIFWIAPTTAVLPLYPLPRSSLFCRIFQRMVGLTDTTGVSWFLPAGSQWGRNWPVFWRTEFHIQQVAAVGTETSWLSWSCLVVWPSLVLDDNSVWLHKKRASDFLDFLAVQDICIW